MFNDILIITSKYEVKCMNVLHMKYAVEIAKVGSVNKAAENLFMAPPNLSRALKELEADLGITIFDRSAKGVALTPDGEEFVGYAKILLEQIEQIENLYTGERQKKQKFSISVPRACYISHAFAQFSKMLTNDPAEIFYKETNSQRTIHNILQNDYKLGIIRYAENYDKFFKTMLEEKDLVYEMVTEFSYKLIMSADSQLAKIENITFDDLKDYIEIAHADPYVPSLPFSKVAKEELPDNIERRIFIFERASQFDLLSHNSDTFMWVSPAPQEILDKYNLVQKVCVDNKKKYKDVLVYKKGYKLTEIDKKFITALCDSKRKHL